MDGLRTLKHNIENETIVLVKVIVHKEFILFLHVHMCTCAFTIHVHEYKLIELNRWKHIRVEQKWHFTKAHNYHSICTWVVSTHVF
jgi:hypothetical protein